MEVNLEREGGSRDFLRRFHITFARRLLLVVHCERRTNRLVNSDILVFLETRLWSAYLRNTIVGISTRPFEEIAPQICICKTMCFPMTKRGWPAPLVLELGTLIACC